MNTDRYLRRIRQEFPDLKFKKVRIPPQGIDHVALILDEKWVFRFPIQRKYKDLFPQEIPFLEALHKRLPVAIPHYTLIARDHSFGAYRMITGETLQAVAYRHCTPQAQKRMQTQIAKFLSALHTTPLPFAKKYHVPVMDYRKELSRRLREYRRYLRTSLKKEEQKRVDAFFDDAKQHVNDPYTPCLIHCDLYTDHIYIDERHTKISGVIDFGDRAIFDPALDFHTLWDYGHECIENIYSLYTGPKDPTFLERSRRRFLHGAVAWVGLARHRKWKAEKEAYAHFKKYFR